MFVCVPKGVSVYWVSFFFCFFLVRFGSIPISFSCGNRGAHARTTFPVSIYFTFFLLPPARRGYVFFNNIISLIIRCVVICFPLSSGGVSSVVVYVLSLPPSPSSSRCSQKNHFTLFTLPGGKGKGCC